MRSRSMQRESRNKSIIVSRIGQRRQIVIPKVIFDELRLQEGDFMEVTAKAGRVSMKPKKLVDTEEVLTRAEAKKLRHGLKQVKAKKTRSWDRIKDELGL